MKNNKLFLLTIVLSLLFAYSCDDEVERTIYQDGGNSELTFLSFTDDGFYDLPVANLGTGEVVITLESSFLASQDRSYALNLLEEETTADVSNFNIPASITIPANSYFGTAVIEGNDLNDSLSLGEILQIAFTASPNQFSESFDSNLIVVSMFEDTPFTGSYLLEELTDYVDGPTLSDGQVVSISFDASDPSGLSRIIETQFFPNYCTGFNSFSFTLSGNAPFTTSVPAQDNTCVCADGTDWFGTADSNESYDPDDDSVFMISFLNDVQEDCAPVETTTYKLTKQ